MPKMSGKATISMRGNSNNLPDLFFKELVQKMGWEVQTREELLDSFIESRPEKSSLSDEEIMNEVRAVRYSLLE